MNPLSRLIKAIDDTLAHTIDRHLEIAIPKQRRSLSPLAIRALETVDVERVGTFPCCECCTRYYSGLCVDIHRTPCDKPECGQDWPDGGAA